jgi:hypothetical protein
MNARHDEVIEREVQTSPQMLSMLQSAEIDQQIATAHRFPRSITQFRKNTLEMVMLTEKIAQECIYALKRDDKVIEGPSARFAEIIASSWGNCRAGARVVNEGEEFVTAQGVFHDLEQNVAITYEVQRRIVNKHGKRFSVDMIGVTANAACSIALRNAILKGVPKAFWSEAYSAARKTIAGDTQTLSSRRDEAIKSFVIFGVTDQMIFQLLEVQGKQDITIDHLVTLKGFLTSLQESETTVEQLFGVDPKKTATGTRKTEKLEYPKEKFDTDFPGWKTLIETKKKTVKEVLAMVESKYTLSNEQHSQISNLGE